jgi:small GTP-binding protein
MPRTEFRVSLVGRPNVGKSTLFNRITGKRRSITYGEPGVTRDLVSLPAEYDGKRFRLVDTGGYLSGEKGDILSKVRGQVLRAIYESDAVIILVDARDGVLPLDKEIVAMLREREKRFFLAANKVDTREGMEMAGQFHELAVGTVYPISAEHGTGVSDLLDAIVPLIPDHVSEDEATEEAVARVAVLGRPNVGKSTLINTMVGYDRVIASEIPGTTRDAIDVLVNYGGKKFQFIDTAGIRAKRKTESVLEKYSVIKSLESLKRCDLAVLMMDGPGGLTHQDQQILGRGGRAEAGAPEYPGESGIRILRGRRPDGVVDGERDPSPLQEDRGGFRQFPEPGSHFVAQPQSVRISLFDPHPLPEREEPGLLHPASPCSSRSGRGFRNRTRDISRTRSGTGSGSRGHPFESCTASDDPECFGDREDFRQHHRRDSLCRRSTWVPVHVPGPGALEARLGGFFPPARPPVFDQGRIHFLGQENQEVESNLRFPVRKRMLYNCCIPLCSGLSVRRQHHRGTGEEGEGSVFSGRGYGCSHG